MENKSPFGVAGSEFDEQGYDSTNESDLEISSGKKKKSKVSEIWNKLFNRESDEPYENQKSFVESFSSLFGRLIGVDRDSNEDEKGSHQEYAEEARVNSFNIPLVNTAEVVNVDDTVIKDDNYIGIEDNSREYDTEKDEVDTVLGLHDKVINQATIPDVRSRDSNDILVERQSDFDNTADGSQLSDLDDYESHPTALRVTDGEIHAQHNQEEASLYDVTRDAMNDQQVPQDIHHTGYEENNTREESISRGVAHNSKDYADKDSLQKERESRRRLKRQTHKLRKRIDDLHSKQESHQKKLESLQKQEISQDAELLAMGKKELYSPREVSQKINNKNNSGRSGAIFATKYNIGLQSSDGSNIYKEAKDEVYGKRAHDRQTLVDNDSRYLERGQRYNDRYKRINNENRPEVVVNTITGHNLSEVFASNEVMDSDSMLHRKIEAKDSDEKFQTALYIKANDESGIRLEGAKSSSYGNNDHQVTKIKSLDNKISLLEHHHQESRNATDEYRKAIKTGINTGIIMLVSLGLVAFIWSLLN